MEEGPRAALTGTVCRTVVPRPLIVLVLAAVAGVAGVGVASAEGDDAASLALGAPSPVTPVLSARRAPALVAAPIADRRLGAALDELLGRQPGTTCLTVTAGGRPVYEARPDAPLVPASVVKLVTALAALEVLGPDHTFRTTVVATAPPADGVVAGDLWLVGSGDPLLATAAYAARFERQPQLYTPIEPLADAVVAAGVTAVTGRLVGDDTRYDRDRYPDHWPERFVAQDQSGPLSALTVNDAWESFPPNHEAREPDESPAADPAAHGAAVLRDLLAERGVAVTGAAASGPAPSGAVELAAVESPPLAEIVGELLRESDNQTGELLLKEIALARGRPPTTDEGAAVARQVLDEVGLPAAGAVIEDGSGLGGGNRVTCRLVGALLDRAGFDSAIGRGLAVGGQTGTLAKRFTDPAVAGRVVAKTGTLNQVTALAGFVATAPGATLTFAFIANVAGDARIGAEDFARQEELGAALVRYPEGPALDVLGPEPIP